MTRVDTAWKQIEVWLDGNAPELSAGLLGPATDEDIDRLRAVFGQVPPSLEASYRRHSGEADVGGGVAGWELLSVDRILEEHQAWIDVDSQDSPDPSWIPVTSSGGGEMHFVRPDGSVVMFDSDAEEVAASWEQILEWYAIQLESGNWVLDEEEGLVDQHGDTGNISAPTTSPTPAEVPPAQAPPRQTGSEPLGSNHRLLVANHSILPPVCCKCGAVQGIQMVHVEEAWIPLWKKTLVVFGLGVLPGLVLLQLFGKEANIQVGVCEAHAGYGTQRKLIGYGTILAGVALLFLGSQTPEPLIALAIALLLAIFGAGILTIWSSSPIRITNVSSEGIELDGAHPDFISAIEHQRV